METGKGWSLNNLPVSEHMGETNFTEKLRMNHLTLNAEPRRASLCSDLDQSPFYCYLGGISGLWQMMISWQETLCFWLESRKSREIMSHPLADSEEDRRSEKGGIPYSAWKCEKPGQKFGIPHSLLPKVSEFRSLLLTRRTHFWQPSPPLTHNRCSVNPLGID